MGVQHHLAHVLACMAENELEGPVLGVSWDGTGYGIDGTIWGGEFLWATPSSFGRVAHLRQFRLAGGESAVKEPRRSALGLLYEIYGNGLFAKDRQKQALPLLHAFSARELALLQTMLQKKINAPLTSSMGRLFDAVAAMVGLSQTMSFEGQAAMELEFALHGVVTDEGYDFDFIHDQVEGDSSPIVIDWEPIIDGIITDMRHSVPVGMISAKYHNTLVETIVFTAQQMGEEQVVLTGGCFQNKYLTERAIQRLRSEGFRPYWHQRVPPNDGGIALGQIVAATQLKE
jgi:hydrogenase maturation protein HypF